MANANGTAITTSPAIKARSAGRKDGWGAFFSAYGWNNTATGKGIAGKDRNLSAGFAAKAALQETQLRDLYRFDGLSKRIIDLPVEAMTSKGFEVTGDPEGLVLARMQETGMFPAIESLLRWARLFGGALGIIGADDGQKYEFPLNEKRIKGVHYLHVYHRYRVSFNTGDLYSDPQHPKFGQPQWYWVQPVAGSRFKVHESRTIRMYGAPVDDLTAAQNLGWADSHLQAPVDDIRRLEEAYGSAADILDDFITETITLKNLTELISMPGGEEILVKRLNLIAKSRAITNARMLDGENETFNKVASSVAGISDILDRFFNKLSATTGIPVTLLAGQAPAGLNSTGDADTRSFYDKMEAAQQKDLRPVLERLIKLILLSSEGGFTAVEPETWDIKFRKLWQPTAKEEVEMGKGEADTLKVYYDLGAISEDEIRDVIRDRYNLVGDAPEPPEPLLMPGEPGAEGALPAKPKAGKEEPDPQAKGDAARAAVLEACRGLVPAAQRADSAEYEIATIHVTQEYPGRADTWIEDRGFSADVILTTPRGKKYTQRQAADFAEGTLRSIRLEPGIEITIGKIRA